MRSALQLRVGADRPRRIAAGVALGGAQGNRVKGTPAASVQERAERARGSEAGGAGNLQSVPLQPLGLIRPIPVIRGHDRFAEEQPLIRVGRLGPYPIGQKVRWSAGTGPERT